jgi:glycosyltransferase involved in cell wall biosynthesis
MRLLILVPGDVGEKMSGPAIRAWLLAHALSDRHEVTAAIDGQLPELVPPGVRVIRATRRRLLLETQKHEAVIASCPPPYMLMAARARGVLTVADHYDPVELELSTLEGVDRRMEAVRALRRLQHQHTDVILCASVAQRRMLLEELDQIGRSGDLQPPLGIIPFGIPAAPPRSDQTPLRDRFKAIGPEDKIVLWWGKIWSWFDAETAIRAFGPLAGSRPDIKLVITAGRAPDRSTEVYSLERQAREVATELGLLNRTVFFLEEWLPYDERHHCLHEADLGLTLHANTPEAEFAARARYMDYVWAGLPCVLAAGDEIADRFADEGFARLVVPGDTEAVTRAIIDLLDSPQQLAQSARAGTRLADTYRWPSIALELSRLLEEAADARVTPSSSVRLAGGTSRYYTRRLVDRIAMLLAPRAAAH